MSDRSATTHRTTKPAWHLPSDRPRWHGLAHHRRNRHLHDLRGRLYLLPWPRRQRAHAPRGARTSDLRHRLPALQQLLHLARRARDRARQDERVQALVGANLPSRRDLPLSAPAWSGTSSSRAITSPSAPISSARPSTRWSAFTARMSSSVCCCCCCAHVSPSPGKLRPEHAERVQVLALYWHFVDAVWVVVFTVVYVVGR